MNIITIDADKAAEEIKKTILRDCTAPVSESVEEVAKEIIDTICREYQEPISKAKNQIKALIQTYVEEQVADLEAENERLKKRFEEIGTYLQGIINLVESRAGKEDS